LPFTMPEKLFTTLIMLIGFILLVGVMIGGWSSILTNNFMSEAMFVHRVKTVNACLVSTAVGRITYIVLAQT